MSPREYCADKQETAWKSVFSATVKKESMSPGLAPSAGLDILL